MASQPASAVVAFYRLWHGLLKLKGAGYLIGKLAPFTRSLQNYPLLLPEGQSISLDFRDISAVCWLNHTLGDSFEETGLIQAMNSLINAETVVWDVGANCGKVSYILARETPACRLVFFEPINAMYQMARSALAPFDHASGMNLALSNSNGRAKFFIPHGNSTTAAINTAANSGLGRTCYIECRIGDDLVSTGAAPPPQVIKIDTEGHEVEVLLGLQQVIHDHRPSIFLEHISLTDSAISKIVPERYEIFSVSNEDGSLRRGFDRSKGHNTALLPKSL